MTDLEKEYTKIIAEFDGHEYCEEGDWMQYGGVMAHWDDLWYNKSYDRLMPVWVKFKDVGGELGLSKIVTLNACKYKFRVALVNKSIAEAFTELAKAIKWYNENK
jgi:hypothetical protein